MESKTLTASLELFLYKDNSLFAQSNNGSIKVQALTKTLIKKNNLDIKEYKTGEVRVDFVFSDCTLLEEVTDLEGNFFIEVREPFVIDQNGIYNSGKVIQSKNVVLSLLDESTKEIKGYSDNIQELKGASF